MESCREGSIGLPKPLAPVMHRVPFDRPGLLLELTLGRKRSILSVMADARRMKRQAFVRREILVGPRSSLFCTAYLASASSVDPVGGGLSIDTSNRRARTLLDGQLLDQSTTKCICPGLLRITLRLVPRCGRRSGRGLSARCLRLYAHPGTIKADRRQFR